MISPRLQKTLIWLLGGSIAYGIALVWLSGAHSQGTYTPMGNDSFYHARRILDAAADPSAFYEFDSLAYVPGGIWISWPWLYDWTCAWVVRLVVSWTPVADPMAVLVYIPPVFAFVNAALILAIGVVLGLSPARCLVLVLCFALSPLTQQLHGAGRIDHHFAEHTFVLATLLGLLRTSADPEQAGRAAMLGGVLGLAIGVHNGLFLLQLPVLATLGIMWLRDQRFPMRNALAFSAALVAVTLAVLIPSESFGNGQFEFGLLSWFHLYAACACSVLVIAMSRLTRSRMGFLGLLMIGLAVSAPILGHALLGLEYIGGRVEGVAELGEMRTAFGLTENAAFAWFDSWRLYSGLIWLSPVVLIGAVWLLLSGSSARTDTALAVFVIFGLFLLHQQYRFHYYGSFALYLPWLVAFERWERNRQRLPRFAWPAFVIVLVVAYYPVRDQLLDSRPTGLSLKYQINNELYSVLADACARAPGAVLSDPTEGHYIRFRTDCSVLANNMFLGPAYTAQNLATRGMFERPAHEIRREFPWVKYVVVGRTDSLIGYPSDVESRLNWSGMRGDLLGPLSAIPTGFVPLFQVHITPEGGNQIIYARLFEVQHRYPGSVPATADGARSVD